ncbi:Alpha/Beta hydrolase protein [Trichoderma asperelloides]|nr:Alpha/Beta hydrolase protein [Trichoderma asperelloides]
MPLSGTLSYFQITLTALTAGLLPIAGAIPAQYAEAEVQAGHPNVTIPSGTIIGSTDGEVESFKGIPYADPPIGDLRFRPPVRLSTHLGEFDATREAAACHRGPIYGPFADTEDPIATLAEIDVANSVLKDIAGDEPTKFDEDCLTITVQRPEGIEAGANIPVLFWIYGGGFVGGSTTGFDGTELIKTGVQLNQPFIFVAVNYRVGGWGFMPGEEILREGSGNAGLRDQRMGLEWVADNIAEFGGDPERVTIWGESAGAISVFDQLVLFDGNATYKGRELFRGAIMNSGTALPTDPLDGPKGQAIYDAVVKEADCDNEREDSLSCLRKLNNDNFTAAANSVPGIFSYPSLALSYLPRPDGTVLTDSPDALARQRKFHKVPVIMGTQEDEGTPFSLFQNDMGTDEKIVTYLSKYYFGDATSDQVSEFVGTYSDKISDGSPFRSILPNELYPGKRRIAAILGDMVFNLMRRITLQILSEELPEIPSWSYFSSYNYNLGLNPMGTMHGSDIPVLFEGSNDELPTISGRTYYINFLYTGDPNNGSNVEVLWPQWTEGHQLLWFNKSQNGLKNDTYRESSYDFMFENIDSLRF